MPHAPGKLATALVVCRCIGIILEASALTYSLIAADLSISTLMFLKIVLGIHIPLSLVRLLYDASQVFMNEPLPASGMLMAALVVSDVIMLPILLAAGASSTAVVGYLYKVAQKCSSLPEHFCSRYGIAAVFTLGAWAINVPIACLMAYIGVYWDLAAQNAAAAAQDAAAAHHLA